MVNIIMSLATTPLSESVQMYLITISRLRTDGRPVPLSQLAMALGISPASTNEMCRKLQEQGLALYRPYKGVSLTPEGERLAYRILRCHRLWEVFLVGKLGFEYDQAHEIACELEHATPDLLADQLDLFLGHPQVNPRGEPIPLADGRVAARPLVSLAALSTGQRGHVVRCDVEEETTLAFLSEHGVRPGAALAVMAATDDSLLVQLGNKTISLARALAEAVQVDTGATATTPTQPIPEKEQEMQAQTSIKQVSLDKLSPGQQGVVVRVGGKGPAKRRMMDMGLVPGSKVKVVRVAPLGDPIEFELKGYSLSLRKSEAREITVEVSGGEEE